MRLRLTHAAATTLLAGALASAAAAGAGAAGSGRARAAASHTVVIRNYSYSPQTLRVRRGDSVTWQWRSGSVLHNVYGSRLHSRTQARGSYTVRFTSAGTYSSYCSLHPFMTGKIVVR